MPLATGPDANALLTTALEKLLYLESRLESAEAAREEASRESARQREAAKELRRSLVDWQKRARDAEVQVEGAERAASRWREAAEAPATPSSPRETELAGRLADAEARLERFANERESWLDRMVSLSRLRSDEDDGTLDLGSFIAELRGELMALRRGEERVRATVADRPAMPDASELVARAPEPEIDAESLLARARLTRPERTLARLCARDLSSDSPSVRRRAAERLTEAGLGALNPLVQAKLKDEPDAHARVAYLGLLASTGGETASLALAQALGDADSLVRASAVDALAHRRDGALVTALADDSPAVRRRALARFSKRPDALDALADALGDEDESVRKVAALALAAKPGREAEAILQQAAHSADASTRALARDALVRRGVEVRASPAESAHEEPAPAAEPVASELADRVVEEIRTALRGRTPDELAERLSASPEAISACVEALVGAGALVWRGVKLYLP